MRALLSCFGKFRLSPELSMALAFPLLPLRFYRKTDDAEFFSVLICVFSSCCLFFSLSLFYFLPLVRSLTFGQKSEGCASSILNNRGIYAHTEAQQYT